MEPSSCKQVLSGSAPQSTFWETPWARAWWRTSAERRWHLPESRRRMIKAPEDTRWLNRKIIRGTKVTTWQGTLAVKLAPRVPSNHIDYVYYDGISFSARLKPWSVKYQWERTLIVEHFLTIGHYGCEIYKEHCSLKGAQAQYIDIRSHYVVYH